jgi:type II secretory pathway pseudopilin PulG
MLATSYQRQREYRRQRGSSIVELVIVVAIVVILSGMAIINTMGSSNTTRANNATDAVVDALRQARQLAVTKRRNVLVSFNGTNQVQLTMEPQPGEAAPTPFPVVQLNDGTKNALQFYLFSSLPNTPMGPLGFGNNSAIDLEPVNGGGAGTVVLFSSSGSLVGPGGVAAANYYAVGNNDPINATIYIGNPGNTATARAITVVGATGRVRSYAWNGLAWQE